MAVSSKCTKSERRAPAPSGKTTVEFTYRLYGRLTWLGRSLTNSVHLHPYNVRASESGMEILEELDSLGPCVRLPGGHAVGVRARQREDAVSQGSDPETIAACDADLVALSRVYRTAHRVSSVRRLARSGLLPLRGEAWAVLALAAGEAPPHARRRGQLACLVPGADHFAFATSAIGSVDFFETELMADYSEAVILEGDNPLGYIDLDVSVAPPPAARQALSCGSSDRAVGVLWLSLGRRPGVAGCCVARIDQGRNARVLIVEHGRPRFQLGSSSDELGEEVHGLDLQIERLHDRAERLLQDGAWREVTCLERSGVRVVAPRFPTLDLTLPHPRELKVKKGRDISELRQFVGHFVASVGRVMTPQLVQDGVQLCGDRVCRRENRQLSAERRPVHPEIDVRASPVQRHDRNPKCLTCDRLDLLATGIESPEGRFDPIHASRRERADLHVLYCTRHAVQRSSKVIGPPVDLKPTGLAPHGRNPCVLRWLTIGHGVDGLRERVQRGVDRHD
jgi:hypothetical protein